jgi:Ser/Thr protein kinase RdoA (MazF antagonist)
MKHNDILHAFGIDINKLQNLQSLYAYAPVYRFNYEGKDYVLKRTGIRSHANAIARWTRYLVSQEIKSVAPVRDFGINPRCLTGKNNTEENWVIYPFIKGITYTGNHTQIYSAGKLLGKIHAVGMNTDFQLKVSETVIVIEAQKIESEISVVLQKIEQYTLEKLENIRQILNFYSRQYLENVLPRSLKINLPLTNCSWDYKAANLIYQTDNSPVAIDPDHCGRIPRMYDLATALLLFHGDLPPAPKRMFTPTEWQKFLAGYKQYVRPTEEEISTWKDVLFCAWIDQALWLLSHFPEGWADREESSYLLSLLTTDLSQFSLQSS